MSIAEIRGYLNEKGWLNNKEICKYVPCNEKVAKSIHDYIHKNYKLNEYEKNHNKVSAKNMMRYLGI